MMNMYSLPTTVIAGEQTLHIRNDGDWRMVIDVNIALADPELSDDEKVICAMMIFYDSPIEEIADLEAAARGMMAFLSAGTDDAKSKASPKLIDWEGDAPLIMSGINKVLGHEVRAVSYLHWWTFIAAYMAIGDSALATVVSIRDKITKGKKLEKHEKEFRRDNPQYFNWRRKEADAANEMLRELWEE